MMTMPRDHPSSLAAANRGGGDAVIARRDLARRRAIQQR